MPSSREHIIEDADGGRRRVGACFVDSHTVDEFRNTDPFLLKVRLNDVSRHNHDFSDVSVQPAADKAEDLRHPIVILRVISCLRRGNGDQGRLREPLFVQRGSKHIPATSNRCLFVTPFWSISAFHRLSEVVDEIVHLTERETLSRVVFAEEVANVIWLQKSVVWASEFVNL